MDATAGFPMYPLRALRAARLFGLAGVHRDRHSDDDHSGDHDGEHGRRGGRGHRGGHRGGHPHGHGHGFGPGFGGFGPGFGPGFPFGGPRQRRGSRASRGDIRLAALALLDETPMHGYQLMREISDRSDGMWKPSPGAIYPALQQLEDEGLIEPERAEGKRVFRLTGEGRTYVEEHRAEIDAVWRSFEQDLDEEWIELSNTGQQVMQAFGQVISAGNRSQIVSATELMAETRRRLYRILAEDEPATGPDTDEPGPAPATDH